MWLAEKLDWKGLMRREKINNDEELIGKNL
jgi:hypothetical protein